MTCRWNGSDRPRTIAGRHLEECRGITAFRGAADYEECRGCQPCTEPHCRICSRTHAEGTCAECLAETRANLHEIARLCGSLPEEVAHRGVEGEAMMLLGPAADPEARGHLEASVACGRVSADYLETADNENHPLFVLGSWDSVWRDALEHDDSGPIVLTNAVDYLDRTMGYMAGYEHVPFEDFARDLRRCVAHLEAVLHDGEQVERSHVTCIEPECTAPLERIYAASVDHDGWRCSSSRCRATYDHARYARAMHEHLAGEGAERWVKVAEALSVIPRPEMTLRTWITNGDVASRRTAERGVEVWWPDVRRKHIESAKRARKARPCA